MAKESARRATSSHGRFAPIPSALNAEANTAIPAGSERVLPDSSATQAFAWRIDALAVAIVLLATGIVSWHRLWLQNGLAHLDIPTFYLPWYAYMGEHLRQFDIPGWNPHLFSGTPFAGDPQSGWMYLPAMAIFTLFESVRAYEIFLIFHLALAGVATYAFARLIGLRPAAGLVAAFAYEFGPLVNHISCCVIHVQLATWIPVALLGVELTMRSRTWSGRAAAWCLTGFAVSQMIAGWVGQGAYNGLLVVATYIVFRTLFTAVAGVATWRQRLARMVIDGAATFMLGAGLSAAGLLPRLTVVEHTNLAGGEYSGHEVDLYSSGWGVTTLIDNMISTDNGFRSATYYLGAPAIVLFLIGVYLARSRFRAPYFALVTAFASFMTLHRGSLHDVVFALLPRYEALHEHVPTRVLVIQWIGPAMLAGIAVEMLHRDTRFRVKRAAIISTSIWGLGAFALVVLYRGISLASLAFALVTGVIAALFASPRLAGSGRSVARLAQSRRLLGALLLIVVFADPTGREVVDTLLTGQRNQLLALPTGPVARGTAEINAAKTDEDGAGGFFQREQKSGAIFRYFGYNYALNHSGYGYPSTYREYYWLPEAQALLVNARAMPLDLNDIQGYNPMQLSNYINAILFANHSEQNYHDSQIMPSGLASPILDMLNVRYIVIPNEIPPGRPRPDIEYLIATHNEVFRNDLVRVLENDNALPRAWIVHDGRAATSNFALTMIDSGLVDPSEIVFLDSGTRLPSLAAPDEAAKEQVTITEDASDRISMAVTLTGDGLVVVSSTYDSDWNAYVDGKPVPLYQANGVIQAIPVPAGIHRVELVYEPDSLRIGLAISAAFAALSLAIVAAFVWSRRGSLPLGLKHAPGSTA